MAQRENGQPRSRRTWWAFDRPVLRDGLLWSGLVLGLTLAVTAIAGSKPTEPLAAQVLEFIGGVALGVFVVGALGGALRNFWRGYTGT